MQKRNPGFSLIELLIVIAIIAILAAGIATIINDSSARNDARRVTALNDFKVIQKAIVMARAADGIPITVVTGAVNDGEFIGGTPVQIDAVEKYMDQALSTLPATYTVDAGLQLVDSMSTATLQLKN